MSKFSITKKGVVSRFYEEVYRTNVIYIVGDDDDWIFGKIKEFAKEVQKEWVPDRFDCMGDVNGISVMGATLWNEHKWYVIIWVRVSEKRKMWEIQQTVIHETIHAAYRMMWWNGVEHDVEKHEHLNILVDRLCREVIPHFWEYSRKYVKR